MRLAARIATMRALALRYSVLMWRMAALLDLQGCGVEKVDAAEVGHQGRSRSKGCVDRLPSQELTP